MFKKIKSMIQTGLDPIMQGKHNFHNPTPKMERLARERMAKCECLEDEPVKFLRVEDKRIPELSGKVCGKCGCTASYLLRQNIKFCEGWEK